MNSRIHIENELRELNSTLPSHVKEPVFSVPEGYFENFAASVLAKLKEGAAVSAADELASLSPLLAGLSKKMPYDLPENYFSALSAEVPLLLDEQLPSVLANHSKINPYEVPAGYFDNFPTQILAKVTGQREQAKVIFFNRTRWMRVAVAAVVAGIIAISGLVYFNGKSASDQHADSTASVATSLQGVSNQELESFMETADISASTEVANTNPAQVRSLLKDVSVNEIDAFLAQMPVDEDLSVIN